jgi:hypothetical protein
MCFAYNGGSSRDDGSLRVVVESTARAGGYDA